MRVYFFSIFLCLFYLFAFDTGIYAQVNIEISKRGIKKIFRQNYKGTIHNWKKHQNVFTKNISHKNKYRTWGACNTDSTYFFSDTVIMYNNENAPNRCSSRIQWTFFFRKNEIRYVVPDYRVSISKTNHRIKVKTKNKDVFIEIYKDPIFNNGKEELKEKFLVLDLRKEFYKKKDDSPMYVMTLKRLYKPPSQ